VFKGEVDTNNKDLPMTAHPKIQAKRENTLRSTKSRAQNVPERLKVRRDAPKSAKKKPIVISVPPNGTGTRSGRLKNLGGSLSDTFNDIIAKQTVLGLWLGQSDQDETTKQFEATVAALIGIKPRDELEGMLAAQMVATHNAAMECFRRAMIPEQTFEGRRESLNQANKLIHSYTTLIEALDRHRGKGQQHVTVEHVHVNEGGQAIVGTVNSRGRGVSKKNEEQPHAPAITHEKSTQMPSPDPERQAVPISGRKRKIPL